MLFQIRIDCLFITGLVTNKVAVFDRLSTVPNDCSQITDMSFALNAIYKRYTLYWNLPLISVVTSSSTCFPVSEKQPNASVRVFQHELFKTLLFFLDAIYELSQTNNYEQNETRKID